MQFLSPLYGVFLLCVIGIFWSVRQPWLRSWLLFLSSLIFYSSLQAQFIPLLLVATLINFVLGRALGAPANWRNDDWQFAQADWNKKRFKLLWIGIFLNILLLLGFKYVPFILGTIAPFWDGDALQQSANWTDIHLIAPLGLSFFTFECIAYLVDVYRGAPAAQNFLSFSAYKLFFAKLISGPIVRYHPFNSQLETVKSLQVAQVTEGLWLIASGAVKKGLIADRLNVLVNLSFDNVQRAGSADLWLVTFAYGLQLYLDFSGYVDVARGSALLLGIELPENFDFPYLTTSIADFWRRWHMTLGEWLRNYLYFPLGGSRQGLIRTCINLVLVMLIAGIWHGAAWGFVVWGGLHGLALAVHRLTEAVSKWSGWLERFWQSLPGILLAWVLTQTMVFGSWIFFRLPNVQEAWFVVQRLWGQTADIQFAQKVYGEAIGLTFPQIAIALGAIALGMLIAYIFQRGLKVQLTWHLKLLLIPVCLYAVWQLAPEGGSRYIYFDF
ncbi:MAG: MBOAT family protein [Myxacorys californica WJT36-NPBG1]|jgi:alginate O-acetyltransferase complex protein AlgI|nr:MBOAT family protein [Myxacorys californica WJT36-NPBG1]